MYQHTRDGNRQRHIVLNLMAAEAATISGRKKKAPHQSHSEWLRSAILLSARRSSEDHRQQFDHRSADNRRDQRYMVPISASRIPAPMRRSVSLVYPRAVRAAYLPAAG